MLYIICLRARADISFKRFLQVSMQIIYLATVLSDYVYI